MIKSNRLLLFYLAGLFMTFKGISQKLTLSPLKTFPASSISLHDLNGSEDKVLMTDSDNRIYVYDLIKEKHVNIFEWNLNGESSVNGKTILDLQFGSDDQQLFISIGDSFSFYVFTFFIENGKATKIEYLDIGSLDGFVNRDRIFMQSHCNLLMFDIEGGDYSTNNAGIMAFYQDGQPLKAFNALARPIYKNQGRIDYLINNNCTSLFLLKEKVKKEQVSLNVYRFDFVNGDWKKTKTHRNIPLKTKPVNYTDAPDYFLADQNNGIFSIGSLDQYTQNPTVLFNTIDLAKKKAIMATFKRKEQSDAYDQLLASINDYGGVSHFSRQRNFIKDMSLEGMRYGKDSVYVYTDSVTNKGKFDSYSPPEFIQYYVDYNIGTWVRHNSILMGKETNVMKNKTNSILYHDNSIKRAFEIYPKINETSFAGGIEVRDLNSYELTQQSEFNVLPKESAISRILNSLEDIRCEKPDDYGLMSGVTISYPKSKIDTVAVDCNSYDVSIWKNLEDVSIQINLKEVLDALQSKIGSLGSEEVFSRTSYLDDPDAPSGDFDPEQILAKTSYFKIVGISNDLVHVELDVLTKNRMVFSWNSSTNIIQDAYRFNYSGFPDVWDNFAVADSINYFYDFRVDKELTDSIFDQNDLTNTLFLYQYNVNSGKISVIDSTAIDISSSNFDLLEKTNIMFYQGNIDYYEDLDLMSVVFPRNDIFNKNQIILYDKQQSDFFLKMNPPFDGVYDIWSSETVQKFIDDRLHPLLRRIYNKIDYDSYSGELKLLSYLFDSSSTKNTVFAITPNGKIYILNRDLLLELQYNEDKTIIISSTTVNGGLVNYMSERKIMVTLVSELDRLYHVYGLSPATYLMSIQYFPDKVRFESKEGYYTEISTFQNKDDDTTVYNDILKHRPDKILELLKYPHAKNKLLFERVASLNTKNLDTIVATGTSIPAIDFAQLKTLNKVSIDKSLQFNVKAKDSLGVIDQVKIRVNGVQQNAFTIPEDELTKVESEIPIQVDLSWGKNLIEIEVRNQYQQWSKPLEYICYYIPKEKKQSQLLFAGIGFSEYQDTTKVLNASDDDIRDLMKALGTSKGFQLVDTLINYKANMKTRLKGLNQSLRKSSVDDRVILLLSGHGMLDADKLTWYFATHNTNFNAPHPENNITFEDLDDLFDGVPARNRLILIDACHAGQSYFEYMQDEENEQLKKEKIDDKDSAPSVPFELLEGFSEFIPEEAYLTLDYEAFKIITKFFPSYIKNGSTVVTASRGEQTAKENKENGFFTRAILDILGDNSDEILTINEFVKQIDQRFSEKAQGQKPSLKGYNPSNNWIIWSGKN